MCLPECAGRQAIFQKNIGFPNHQPLRKVENSAEYPIHIGHLARHTEAAIHPQVRLNKRSEVGFLHSAKLLFLLSNPKQFTVVKLDPSQKRRENHHKSLGLCVLHLPKKASERSYRFYLAITKSLSIWAHDIGREGNGHHGRHIVDQGLGHVLQGSW